MRRNVKALMKDKRRIEKMKIFYHSYCENFTSKSKLKRLRLAKRMKSAVYDECPRITKKDVVAKYNKRELVQLKQKAYTFS